ncbi:MAG: TIGR01777 family oxidoreductase, partial [Mangrovibacterium sp.]
MKVSITGAHGFIGRNLSCFLEKHGIEVSRVSRLLLCGKLDELAADLAGSDAVIHLAGAPVMQRWTRKNKQVIYNSRMVTTWNLAEAISRLPEEKRPRVFIAISGTGIYVGGKSHDEKSPDFSTDFLGKVVTDWEAASAGLSGLVRRVIFRTGLVLGKDSLLIRKLYPLFRAGLGGRIGTGKQAFPFIHITDLERAFYTAISREEFSGIYNLTAPHQATNQDFTRLFSRELQRPAVLRVPATALRLIYGRAAVVLLESPSVFPGRLQAAGFS